MKKEIILITALTLCASGSSFAEKNGGFKKVAKAITATLGASANVQAVEFTKNTEMTSNNNSGGGQYGQYMKVSGGINGNAQIATASDINLTMNNGSNTEQDFQHMEVDAAASLNVQYIAADSATMSMTNSTTSTQALQSMKIGQ